MTKLQQLKEKIAEYVDDEFICEKCEGFGQFQTMSEVVVAKCTNCDGFGWTKIK